MGWTRRARPEAPEGATRVRRARRAAWAGLIATSITIAALAAAFTPWDEDGGTRQVAGVALDQAATTTRPRATTTPSTTTASTSSPSTSTTSTTAPITTSTPTTAIPSAPQPAPPTRPAPPACVPAPVPAPPRWGPDPTRYDPATVQQTADPTRPGCGRTRVLVVGDSVGRGAANALKRANPGDLEIWDRTEHGCGMVAPRQECAGWRSVWTPAVALIDPDIVVVVLGASGDLAPGKDPPFHSAEAGALRRAETGRALDVLSSTGARVVWVLPAVPLPEATFFCGGRIADTPCDRAWIDRWHADVGAVAVERGVPRIDLRRWVASRPGPPLRDRPDGLHLTGPALDAQAAWLLERIRQGGR